jgi:hypothetical protein
MPDALITVDGHPLGGLDRYLPVPVVPQNA